MVLTTDVQKGMSMVPAYSATCGFGHPRASVDLADAGDPLPFGTLSPWGAACMLDRAWLRHQPHRYLGAPSKISDAGGR